MAGAPPTFRRAPVTKSALKRKGGGQPGLMGVVATPKIKEGAYWTHRERKKLGGTDWKCFDHPPSILAIMLPMSSIVP